MKFYQKFIIQQIQLRLQKFQLKKYYLQSTSYMKLTRRLPKTKS